MASQMCRSICREFNVQEGWLLNGTGDVFVPSGKFSLDIYLKDRGADDFEVDIIKAYFDLDPETRHNVLSQFKENLQRRHQMQQSDAPQTDQQEDEVAEAEAEYIKSTSENVQKPDASASNTIDVTA